MNPLVLDFDGAVLALPGERRVPLQARQERMRFGCRMRDLGHLESGIDDALGMPYGTVFVGSGDYHHISQMLIRRQAIPGRTFQVVVFDNHPDNMRYPFGIHCGSWVWHASRLPCVSQVHVLGITSHDVEVGHGWENQLRGLRSGKVRYWCIGRDLGWMRHLGIRGSRSFDSVPDLLNAFSAHLATTQEAVYLSIDKDVLAAEDVRTNWDQGVMRLTELTAAISMLRGRLLASDVTGEVSVYRYQSRFKRLLSGLDGQPEIAPQALADWQMQHQAVNRKLLEAIASAN